MEIGHEEEARSMRRGGRNHGFGEWAAFCGPGVRFGGSRTRGRMFDRGDLRYMVLALLEERPMHGYEVMQALEKEAGGWYTPSPGSVYPVLQLLQDQGYVTSEERDGKRTYSITDAGRAFLEENRDRVEDVADRVSSFARRFTGPDMRDLTKSFVKFAQVSFEEAVKQSGDTDAMDRLREILERATREMEKAGSGGRENGA
jgi:DNA-binding PadR family transcriptional regulator